MKLLYKSFFFIKSRNYDKRLIKLVNINLPFEGEEEEGEEDCQKSMQVELHRIIWIHKLPK